MKQKMYLYETHVHSREGSACSPSSAREMVNAYKQAGYSGFILTNHFIHGNTSVPRNLPWNDRMQMYYDAYLNAKELGDEIDFDVFFGIEHHYGDGKEVLIYGIDLEFLQAHPELGHADIDTYAKLVHEAGGVLVHAHPHRARFYINSDIQPRYDVCDGIEVYNACDEMIINERAMRDAEGLPVFSTSGGDIHENDNPRIGMAGVCFAHRVRNNQELVASLKSNQGVVLINGNIVETGRI